MRKKTKKRCTEAEAKQLIPHDEFYCNDSGVCPFFRLRTITRSKYYKLVQEGKLDRFVPCNYAKGHKWKAEYCTYLHAYLSVQDGVKDCEINCNKEDLHEGSNK